MDGTWFARIEAEHRAGNVTRGERDVLRALGRLLALGDDMPSEARLASEAACSRRTVQRGKARARELGLLAWERRFAGQRLRRELPCAYRAATPTRAVVRRERQAGALKVVQGNLLRSVQAQIAALPAVTPELRALWAARRAGGGRVLPSPARGALATLLW
jgi:hypothetical protein